MKCFYPGVKKIYPLLFACVMLFFSCKKEYHSKDEVKGDAKIKVINAAPNASLVDFYFNNVKLNPVALAYGENSDYLNILSGQKVARVNHVEQALATSPMINFTPALSYTLFFFEDEHKQGAVLALEDNLGAIEAGKIRVRFVQLNPNLSNTVNISLPGGELLVNSLPFKGTTGYFLLQGGTSFGVSVPGAGVFKLYPASEMEAGKNYTIWLSGSSDATLTVNKITYN